MRKHRRPLSSPGVVSRETPGGGVGVRPGVQPGRTELDAPTNTIHPSPIHRPLLQGSPHPAVPPRRAVTSMPEAPTHQHERGSGERGRTFHVKLAWGGRVLQVSASVRPRVEGGGRGVFTPAESRAADGVPRRRLPPLLGQDAAPRRRGGRALRSARRGKSRREYVSRETESVHHVDMGAGRPLVAGGAEEWAASGVSRERLPTRKAVPSWARRHVDIATSRRFERAELPLFHVKRRHPKRVFHVKHECGSPGPGPAARRVRCAA